MQHFLNGTSCECSECPPFIVLMMTPHVQDLVSHAAVNTQILGRSSSLVLPSLKVPNKILIFSPSNNCSGGDLGGKNPYTLKGIRICQPQIATLPCGWFWAASTWQTAEAGRALWSPSFYLKIGHRISCEQSAHHALRRREHSSVQTWNVDATMNLCKQTYSNNLYLSLLLLSHFSRVWLCVTP